jgi:hypothetical protein
LPRHALHDLLGALLGCTRAVAAHDEEDDEDPPLLPLPPLLLPPLRREEREPELREEPEERELELERRLRERVVEREPELVVAFSWPRMPRVAPRAAPTATSPTFSAPATPSTAPRRSVSRVRGENTAAVIPVTKADSLLIKSSSPKPTLLCKLVVRAPSRSTPAPSQQTARPVE